MNKKKKVQKWYYDACALDDDKDTYKEVFRGKKKGIVAVASNLSIGEAYGNSYKKKGQEAAEAFIDLIGRLNKIKAFEIVNHTGIDKKFKQVRSATRLSITDAMHLATAMSNECCNLITADSDLYDLPKESLKDISKECGVGYCSVTKI